MTAFLGWLFGAYALLMGIYIVLENRRPQATLAWMLILLSFPGLGLLVYVLFGRDRKAFAKQRKLLRQDLEANAKPLVSPILSRQDAAIARLEDESVSRKKLMMLVRRNPQSALTRRNGVEILQNAETFYSRMIEDMKAAQHSIHLQYFIWRRDDFTETLKQILTSGSDSQWVVIRQMYFFMILTAQRHVFLQSPYFILDASIAEALKSAALSGVDVRVMLTARASGNPIPGFAGNRFILDVIRAGVRVFFYEKGYPHAKTISINYEINAVPYSRRLAIELEETFERDLAYCSEFDAQEYRKRSAAFRLRDSVARLFSPLL